jgi:hypothetical protein
MSGYFSFDYLKGESQSESSWGSLQNVSGGLVFSGFVESKFDYVFEARFKGENKIEIEQAWVGYGVSDGFRLRLGLYIVPFGKYNQANRPYQTALAREPINLIGSYPYSWRDIGVLVEGRVGFILYSAYLGNGLTEGENLKAGQQFKDNNSDKGKGARLGFLLGQQLEVGFSVYSGKHDGENGRKTILEGLHLNWNTESFQISSEYSKAEVENPSPYSKGKAEGYYIRLSIPFEKLIAVLSYHDFEYKDSFHGPGFESPLFSGLGISEIRSRWTLGFNYFVAPSILLKLEYEFNREKNITLKDNLLVAQVALNF